MLGRTPGNKVCVPPGSTAIERRAT